MKTITWEIHERNLAHPSKIEHLWWRIVGGIRSLDEAKEQLEREKSHHSWRKTREFKIVRVETVIHEFDEPT